MKYPECDDCANFDTDPAICDECMDGDNYEPLDDYDLAQAAINSVIRIAPIKEAA